MTAETRPAISTSDNDPRVFFAAERTLLAWLRTGLAVIGVGFLVARFGLFLRMLRQPGGEISQPIFSSLIGIGFVLLGAVMIGVAAWQQVRYCRDLPGHQLPPRYWRSFSTWMAALVSLLGIVLAIYLLLSAAVSPV